MLFRTFRIRREYKRAASIIDAETEMIYACIARGEWSRALVISGTLSEEFPATGSFFLEKVTKMQREHHAEMAALRARL